MKKSGLNLLNMNRLLKNKYVLYLVGLVALVDVLGYVMRQEFAAVLFFYLAGLVTYQYTKNMTVVLGTSLIATTVLHLLGNTLKMREGNENMKEGHPGDDSVKEEVVEDDVVEEHQGDDVEEEEEDVEEYQNQVKLKPGMYNTPNKKQLQKQLGKASKLEKAYDDLEKVVGENSIKSMSSNTQNLIKQQNELLKQLKEVTPVLNEAMGSIGKIDLGGLTSLFNKVNSSSGAAPETDA